MESLLFPLLLLVPLLFLIMSQRRKQRAFVEQRDRVQVGTHLMTTAGLFGTVVAVEDDVMVLEVADGVRLRWSKMAVGRIVDTPLAQDAADEVGSDEAAEDVVDMRKHDDVRTEGS